MILLAYSSRPIDYANTFGLHFRLIHTILMANSPISYFIVITTITIVNVIIVIAIAVLIIFVIIVTLIVLT